MELKKYLMLLAIFIVLSQTVFSGCSVSSSEDIEITSKPVKTELLKEKMNPVLISRTGNVIPEYKVTYGFKSSGKIKEIFVESGDQVNKGDPLALLDTSDLNLQLEALKSKMSISTENVEKAIDSYEYINNEYENMKKIYEAGGISKDALEKIKLNRDISKISLKQALEALDGDKAQYDLTKKLIVEGLIISDIDGIVLDTYSEQGEIAGAAQAIVTLRTLSSVVMVGLSQEDKTFINNDTDIEINFNGEFFKGELMSVDDMPDLTTRTYAAKIRINNKKMAIGQIVEVQFNIGEEKGIWISIDAIMSDGEKFVYIVNKERAFKRTITIEEIFGYKVKASGIEEGEVLVVDGMKNLTDGINIHVVE